jgi:hypothetical protein
MGGRGSGILSRGISVALACVPWGIACYVTFHLDRWMGAETERLFGLLGRIVVDLVMVVSLTVIMDFAAWCILLCHEAKVEADGQEK